MIDQVMSDDVDEMDMGDCVDLSRLIRKRMGMLAEMPLESIRIECRVRRTATVNVFGRTAVGCIEEIEGKCVKLRFADQNSLLVPIAALHPDGFDATITVASQLDSLPDAPDALPVLGDARPVLYKGALYLMEHDGDLISEVRQALRSVIPEFALTSELIRLSAVAVDAASVDADSSDCGRGVVELCL